MIPKLLSLSSSRFVYWIVGAVAVSSAIAALPAAAVTGDMQAARLLSAVETKGEVNVIVTLQSSRIRSAVSVDAANDDQFRYTVRQEQESLLGGLVAMDYKVRRQYQYAPQISLRVNRNALRTLLENPEVQVVESRPRRMRLAQSVPRIYPNHATSPYTGKGWSVAVLDTGIDKNHPFLAGRVVSESCFSDDSGLGASTSSLCPNGSAIQYGAGAAVPCSGIEGCEHGTHVAGVAVGDGPTFDGVAREANLIAIQVFSRSDDTGFCTPDPTPCAVAYPDDIIAGLDRVFALRNNFKIAAVNLSLGQPQGADYCNAEPEKPMIDQLRSAGIATVIAAGNQGSEFVDAPACVETAIAVGSTPDNADTRSTYSNNGLALDLYAPGETVTSSLPGGGYGDNASTSVAAAHVSGAWAVLKQALPTASVSQVESVIKSKGPLVTSNAISRRRVDIGLALCVLDNSLQGCPGNGGTDINIVPVLQLLLL